MPSGTHDLSYDILAVRKSVTFSTTPGADGGDELDSRDQRTEKTDREAGESSFGTPQGTSHIDDSSIGTMEATGVSSMKTPANGSAIQTQSFITLSPTKEVSSHQSYWN